MRKIPAMRKPFFLLFFLALVFPGPSFSQKIRSCTISVTDYENGKPAPTRPLYFKAMSKSGKLLEEINRVGGYRKSEYYYDNNDSLIYAVSSNNFGILEKDSLRYDMNGRLIKEMRWYRDAPSRNSVTYYEYNGNCCDHKYYYDGEGRLLFNEKTTCSPNGHCLKKERHNNKGELISAFDFSEEGTLLADHSSPDDTLDGFGNNICEHREGLTIKRRFDKTGKLKLEQEYLYSGFEEQEDSRSVFTYDVNGNLLREILFTNGYYLPEKRKNTYTDSAQTIYKYDSKGNLLEIRSYVKGSLLTRKIIYLYNEKGINTGEKTFNAYGKCSEFHEYYYNKNGQLSGETWYADEERKVKVSEAVYSYEYY